MIAPSEVWAMSFNEWQWLVTAKEGTAPPAPLLSSDLSKLMSKYPDKA
ncbi:MAG: phage tail assembly chaperone [Pseudomonadota bacterium]